MLPSEPTRRKLTPEEEAALRAQQQPATAPPEYAPVEPGMYAEPVPATAPPATAPTYQTDASTSYGNYAPPEDAPVEPTMGTPGYDFMRNGGQGPFTTPTGWQHGAVGTGGGTAGGMMTTYPGGGSSGGAFTPLYADDPIRLSAPQNATAGGGSLLDPNYVPREPGPGQYEPPYHEPGVYTTLPPYREETYNPEKGIYPATEPGMYEGRYERPGQAMVTPPPTEPGMYEPHYTQPGYYTPRSASTYYGGDVWPTPYTGHERLGSSGTTQFGPNPAAVQVITPTTGETTFRGVPDLGTATVLMEGPSRYHDTQPDPALTNRGHIFGGNAKPVPSVTLGTTSNALAYMESQGDPRVTRNAEGRLVLVEDLPEPPPPRVKRLGGLFGGTAPRIGGFRPSTTPVAPTGLKPLDRKPT